MLWRSYYTANCHDLHFRKIYCKILDLLRQMQMSKLGFVGNYTKIQTAAIFLHNFFMLQLNDSKKWDDVAWRHPCSANFWEPSGPKQIFREKTAKIHTERENFPIQCDFVKHIFWFFSIILKIFEGCKRSLNPPIKLSLFLKILNKTLF